MRDVAERVGCGSWLVHKVLHENDVNIRSVGDYQDDPETRFWEKVDKSGDCWWWTAATDTGGYGRFNDGDRLLGAHRYSYKLHHGEIPDGLYVLHTCDNKPCVNPKHLWLGTARDNSLDMVKKGRGPTATRKLTEDEARKVKDLYLNSNMQRQEIAEKFNISGPQVRFIGIGECWSYLE